MTGNVEKATSCVLTFCHAHILGVRSARQQRVQPTRSIKEFVVLLDGPFGKTQGMLFLTIPPRLLISISLGHFCALEVKYSTGSVKEIDGTETRAKFGTVTLYLL